MTAEQKVCFPKGISVLKVKINIHCFTIYAKMNSATVSTWDSSFHTHTTSISVSGRSDVCHYPPKLSNKQEKKKQIKRLSVLATHQPKYTVQGQNKSPQAMLEKKGRQVFCHGCS